MIKHVICLKCNRGYSNVPVYWRCENCASENAEYAPSASTNNDYATALWNYLFFKHGHSNGSSGRSVYYIHLTRKRLNSALKAITKA
jgi:hypothetical protein